MIKLYYSKEVESLLAEGRISKEKIEEIVELAEASGDRIFESATGWFVGKKNEEDWSYWVYYHPYEDGYQVVKADSHHIVVRELKS